MICLPVTAMWWFPEASDHGPARVIVPEGTPVHAVASGRVTKVDRQSVGTVVVRDEAERFHHYRRLQASSITVDEHGEVESGQVVGIVASASDGSQSALLYGMHDNENQWLDMATLLVGATDPTDLFFAATATDSDDPLLRSHQTVRSSEAEASAAQTSPDRATAAAPPPSAASTARPRQDDRTSASEAPSEPVHDDTPTGTPAPAEPAPALEEPEPVGTPESEPEPEPEPEPAPRRSRLAARRPPRRST